MHIIIDRRKNPHGKSAPNRQRLVRRARGSLKEKVKQSLKQGRIQDINDPKNVSIPIDGITEPHFHHDRKTGDFEGVFPGNKEFSEGDKVPRPDGGGGGKSKEGSPDGEGQDVFQFTLTKDEYLDILFDGLTLPNLEKKSAADMVSQVWRRAGFKKSGTPAQLALLRTIKQGYGRRLALGRPGQDKFEMLQEELKSLKEKWKDPTDEQWQILDALAIELYNLERIRSYVPFIDNIDLRFKNFEMEPKPKTKAVMFCLMDVSGSMNEKMKELAKRFFILLYLFLDRTYEHIEIVFIRHTSTAQEVDEETFFRSTDTGGTVISSAFVEMIRIVQERYPVSEWNIYASQASDGDNYPSDDETCSQLLEKEVLPICQFFAYLEILDEREMNLYPADSTGGSLLWKCYRPIQFRNNNFQMKRAALPEHIYPVFHELFSRNQERR